ncbi:TcdA/TcdB catalytic glycosyltransferase domain-containing protein [Vibrio sp. SCSIO 43137]|uniref:TcdA/TcdB catalytic glycosyltransferase domain-containing protein n=1 Tax=Vibrio sp. SCSIO 43137 TaxID=3021011 RepID=UPI00230773EC|nr:TcdA/TcdB catalytic glycosyltransferase domain-containing protein [Vibrio sp. SCSIO 43137]WCE30498.1 TcdA/TcdB catalytic glycosyltransferase domain-containing protein [Vibrio sp. SCSIO 43137]
MKLSFIDCIYLFDDYLLMDKMEDILEYIDERNSGSKIGLEEDGIVPNYYHFIWLGSINDENLEYLFIWKELGASIILWIDSSTKYSSIRNELLDMISARYNISHLKAQDVLYKFSVSQNLVTLDDAIVSYIDQYLPDLKCRLDVIEAEYLSKKSELEQHFTVVDIFPDYTIFENRKERKYFLYETILRGNFAAASDIVRLLILWNYGGVYVDVDTLPSINFDYKYFQRKYSIPKSIMNILDVYVSYNLTLRNRYCKNVGDDKLDYCKSLLMGLSPQLIPEINKTLLDGDVNFIAPELPLVHKSLISISASKNALLEFNNNIIACHEKSKIIRLILREIRRRYTYCERNGIISLDLTKIKKQSNTYYKRLSNYRHDGFDDKDEATLILTGPSLILEVLLGCAYKVAKLDETILPDSISYAFRINDFNLCYSDQTMFTLKHINSSWMPQ